MTAWVESPNIIIIMFRPEEWSSEDWKSEDRTSEDWASEEQCDPKE
jgi:hypothetical protein